MNYHTRTPTTFEAGPQRHERLHYQHDASMSPTRSYATSSQSYRDLEVSNGRPQQQRYPSSSSSSTSISSSSSRHHPYSRSKPDGSQRRVLEAGHHLLPPTPIIRKNTARGAPYHPIYKQVVSGGNTYSLQLPSPPGPAPFSGHEDQHSLTLPPLAFGFERAQFSAPSLPQIRSVVGSHAAATPIDQRAPLGPYPLSLESQPPATHTGPPYQRVEDARGQRRYGDDRTPERSPPPAWDNLVEEVIEEAAKDLLEKRQFDSALFPAYPFARYGDDSDDDMDLDVANEGCYATVEKDYHASYVLSDEESDDDDDESTPSTFGFVPAKFPTTSASASAAVNNATSTAQSQVNVEDIGKTPIAPQIPTLLMSSEMTGKRILACGCRRDGEGKATSPAVPLPFDETALAKIHRGKGHWNSFKKVAEDPRFANPMIQALLRSACEAVNEAVAPFHETLKDVQYACGWHEPGEDKPCGVTVTKRTLCEHLSSAHSVGKKKKSKGRFMCRWLCGVAHEPHETNLNNLSKHIAAVHLQHAKPLSTTLAPNPKPFCEERKVVGTQGGKQVVEYHEVGEGGVKTRKTMEVKMPVVYMLTDIRTDLMERHAWFQVVAWVVEKWLNPMEEE